jgi:hypothetical protein
MSAQLKTLLPQRRNTFVVIVILLVLGIALGLYYFYYIPANKQRLHQYGFRILSAISKNMAERNNDLVKLYTNNVGGEYRYQRTQDTGDIKAALATLPERVRPVLTGGAVHHNASDPGAPTITYMKNNMLEYEVRPGRGIYARLQLPADKLIKPIISYRHELFDNYLIIKRDSLHRGVVYQDDSLGIDNRVEPDSLLAGQHATTFSHITEVGIQGVQYKLFCFPFVLGNEHLMLGGLIKASDYRQRMGSIPVYLIYPLIIVLLLIIISLPFLKIYLMGPYEQVRFSDLIGLGLAVFGGVTVITMIIIQVLLLARGYVSTSAGLRDLSQQIEQAMGAEVQQMQQQLRFLDTSFRRVSQNGAPSAAVQGPGIGVHGRDSSYRIPLFRAGSQPYYNFERVNWVGRNGMQHWRLQVPDTSKVFLINVKERDYFNFFQQQYNGKEDTSVSLMDPVYSWSGGDFVVNLVERSRIDTLLLLTFSAKMYSLLNPVLPPGYGFCIIDNRGRVYIHSEAERSLKENFLDETDNAGPLQAAINSRQDTTLSNVHCYGKEHALYIHPLSQRMVMHPVARRSFFLVTFYNNAYVAPVNLRILLFSLVFTFFTFLLVLLWLLANHGFSRRSLLYRDPLSARFTWIIPRGEDSAFYRKGLLFLSAYLFVLLAAGVFGRLFDDYITFALGLISPLNILILLYAYRIYCKPAGERRLRRRTGLYLLLILLYSGFIYRRLDLGSSADGYFFWLFQGLVMLLPAAMLLAGSKSRQQSELRPVRPDQLLYYSGFVLLLALCLGVLPMTVFTWYAHNREIEQSLKKQQLCMAMTLEKRRPALLGMVKDFRRIDSRVKAYYRRRCWEQGIYGAGDSIISPIRPWNVAPKGGMPAPERFYSRIAAYIDVEYNDPFRYPILNQAADGAWYWEPEDKGLALRYMLSPGSYPDSVQAIRVSMPFPKRYLFLSGGDHITLLAGAVLLLLAGIFILIRSTVSRVFLLDFVRLFGRPAGACPDDTPHTEEQVRDMILEQRQKSALFRSRWNRLSGRQKIILLDLVTDGLANYRNVMEISAMMGEERPLEICEGVIVIRDPVFRQFILEQRLTEETVNLRKLYQARSLWESLRTPLLVIVAVVGLFIFLTQEDISKKLLVLLTTLSTLLPLLPKLLSGFKGAPARGEPN